MRRRPLAVVGVLLLSPLLTVGCAAAAPSHRSSVRSLASSDTTTGTTVSSRTLPPGYSSTTPPGAGESPVVSETMECAPGASTCVVATPFAGSVRGVVPSDCPQLLPSSTSSPFVAGHPEIRLSQFRISGCWIGTLKAHAFTIAEYFSGELGGGVLVEYEGRVHQMQVGTGVPSISRFSGEDVCWSEQAGAYYQGMDLVTGDAPPEQTAQGLCGAH